MRPPDEQRRGHGATKAPGHHGRTRDADGREPLRALPPHKPHDAIHQRGAGTEANRQSQFRGTFILILAYEQFD